MSYSVDDNAYPYSSVVFVEATWGTQTFTGSGVIVGKNDVLTASHCIYNKSLGGLADTIKVYPSYSPGLSDNVAYRPLQILYYDTFDPDSDGAFYKGDNKAGSYAGSEVDISLLSFDLDLSSIFGSMGLDPGFNSGSASVLGYPGKYNKRLTYDNGAISRDGIDRIYNLDSSLEVNPGNSGGPIYYDSSSGPYVVGLVSTSSWAVDLNQHIDWILNQIRADDGFLDGHPLEGSAAGADYLIHDYFRTYPGNCNEYDIVSYGGGLYGVRNPSGVVDSITGLQALYFDDRSLDFDRDISAVFDQLSTIDSVSAVVFRIYKAAFDRLPNADGLRYWSNLNSVGACDYISTCRYFVRSDEFKSLYGDRVSSQDFLLRLYDHVLSRDPDSSGFAFWLGNLDSGKVDRADILLGFANSPENRINFSAATGIS